MQVIVTIAYVLLFILLICKMKFFAINEFSRKVIVGVFMLKIIAGTFLWWLYVYRYPGADLLDYFNDGNILFALLLKHPGQFFDVVFNNSLYPGLSTWNETFEHTLYNDAHTMVLLNTLFRFFSFGYIHVHTVFMNFISLVGLTALYKASVNYFPDRKKVLFAAVFLIPSILFWTSGVLKEGLLFFGVGTLIYVTNWGLETSYTGKKVAMLLFSIFILILVKIYILFALIPGLLVNIWISRTSLKNIFLKYVVIFSLMACFAFGLERLIPDYNILKIMTDKQTEALLESNGGVYIYNDQKVVCINYETRFKQLEKIFNDRYKIKPGSNYMYWKIDNMSVSDSVKNSKDTSVFTLAYEVIPAKSVIKINPINSNVFDLIKSIPRAIFNTLVEPKIWNAKGLMQILSGLENGMFLGFIFVSIFFFNREIKYKPIVFFCLSFVLILFILIGITTPVIGAIVRYKTPALPFLAIALILLIDKKRFLNKAEKR